MAAAHRCRRRASSAATRKAPTTASVRFWEMATTYPPQAAGTRPSQGERSCMRARRAARAAMTPTAATFTTINIHGTTAWRPKPEASHTTNG